MSPPASRVIRTDATGADGNAADARGAHARDTAAGEGAPGRRSAAASAGRTGPAPARAAVLLAVAAALWACGPGEPAAGAGRDGAGGAAPSPGETPGEVHVAVASNFAPVHERLAASFTAATGHRVLTSAGSSGQLFAQVVAGAPFDVFLSADAERPRRLVEEGLAEPETQFTYAVGRLALYGPTLGTVRADAADVAEGRFRNLAVANPTTAPYGAAAVQILERLGLLAGVEDRLVRGENIAQAHQFVRSGGAELGFVALAQVVGEPAAHYWRVPAGLHDPILQDAVLLTRAAARAPARAYVDFLRSPAARGVIEEAGYEVPAALRPSDRTPGLDPGALRPAPGAPRPAPGA